MEIWKDVVGYQGLYQVSNLGRVKRFFNKQQHIRKPQIHKIKQRKRIYNKCGINLFKNGKFKWFTISRMVWQSFNGKIPFGYQIDHINNQPDDNRLENLQLLTRSENNLKKNNDTPDLYDYLRTKIKCLNNGVIYQSQRQAAKELNVNFKSINSVLRGKHKTAKGYTFIYVDEDKKDKKQFIQLQLF